MKDELLEEKFKTLFYTFAEINWGILTQEAEQNYFKGVSKKFSDKQLEDLREFVKDLLDSLTDK